MFDLFRPAALTRFVLLYAAMYAAFGGRFSIPTCLLKFAGVAARAAWPRARRWHGREVAQCAACRSHRRLDPCAPRRTRRLHRTRRVRDAGLSHGAWILGFSWDEPPTCRVAGADHRFGRCAGLGICLSTA